jgi:hypothetical protein
MELVTDERWNRYRESLSRSDISGNSRGRGLLNLIRGFSYDYTKLLDKAVVEFAKELGEVLLKGDIPPKEIEWQEALDASFRFAERFTRDQYAEPWEGFFVLPPRPTDPRSRLPLHRTYLPDKHAYEDFQKMHVLAGLFAEAKALTTPEEVAETFSQAICSDEWKSRAAHRAENQFQYAYPTLDSRSVRTELTEREKKIFDIILRGSRGRQYCRELNNAGIRPLRTGVWKVCPAGTYEAAYLLGKPWDLRIQREKAKIKTKAHSLKLSQLARE